MEPWRTTARPWVKWILTLWRKVMTVSITGTTGWCFMTTSSTEIQKKCIFNLLNGCVSNIFHREHQTVFAVLSSKLFVPLPPRPLPSNHHPGSLQHLLTRHGEKLLLLQRHPRSQPVLGHFCTRGTLYIIEQPGSVTRLAHHFPTRFARAF